MEIYLGKTGLDKTFQEDFPETVKCHKCGGEARIMLVGTERYPEDKGNFICDLHETTGKKGGLWFHDAVAVAVYACKECLEVTAEVNQA